MPVVTRSCGRQGVRRRIEDITPRRPCQTTVKKENRPVKRKIEKCLSDEDSENPVEISHQNRQQPLSPTTETPNKITPVAARTRSFSALKRSYIAKKSQRNKRTPILSTSVCEVQGSNVNAMTEAKVNNDVQGIGFSFNNGNNDVEMGEEQGKNEEVSNIEQTTDEFYKMKFHELAHHVKGIQEAFNNAQKNTTKNIEAYDALIKELKESLEKEKTKVTTTTKELQVTREQLLVAQEQLEKTSQKASDLMPDPLNAANEKADNIQSMIQFYQMLSGMSLTEEPDSVHSFQSYQCVYKPKGCKGKAMKFRLTYDREIEEVEFSPLVQSPSSGEFLQKLPKYFRENIYFSTDQAPGFLLRLIQSYQKQH